MKGLWNKKVLDSRERGAVRASPGLSGIRGRLPESPSALKFSAGSTFHFLGNSSALERPLGSGTKRNYSCLELVSDHILGAGYSLEVQNVVSLVPQTREPTLLAVGEETPLRAARALSGVSDSAEI